MKEKELSRQRKWQLKMRKSGQCQTCGAVLDCASVCYCSKCLIKVRHYMRKKHGFKLYKKGGRGRPPFICERSV